MEIGRLNKRVQLQRPQPQRDAAGGILNAWAVVGDTWAAVVPLSGAERRLTAAGGGEVAEARTEITIRYRTDIADTWRVAYAGRVYEIRHIKDPFERHEKLILTCDTGVKNA